MKEEVIKIFFQTSMSSKDMMHFYQWITRKACTFQDWLIYPVKSSPMHIHDHKEEQSRSPAM